MHRATSLLLLLTFALTGNTQVCARADYNPEALDSQQQLEQDLQKRRAELREMLRAQAERAGPTDPRRLTSVERMQLRQQLYEQRQRMLNQHQEALGR